MCVHICILEKIYITVLSLKTETVSYEGIPTKPPRTPYAEVALRQCLKTLWDCLVYFSNCNYIENTTFISYNLFESSQYSELFFNSWFPANLISKSTACVTVTGGELSDTLIFIKPYETQDPCIHLLSHNFSAFYSRHTNYCL